MDRGGTNKKQDTIVELLEEIVVEILLRLPVKSLLRFKTVCKSWYSIISSGRFIRGHLKLAQAATRNQHQKFLGVLVPYWLACSTCFLFKEDSSGVIHIKEVDLPTKNLAVLEEEIPMWACNSCDGLVCFQLDDGKTILVWNPSVPTEYKVIDYSSFTPGYAAMGYDPRTDDYKIFLVPRYSVIDGVPNEYFHIPLFSVKRNSWTTLRLPKTKDHEICNMKIIYAKKHLHWLAGDYIGVDYEERL